MDAVGGRLNELLCCFNGNYNSCNSANQGSQSKDNV